MKGNNTLILGVGVTCVLAGVLILIVVLVPSGVEYFQNLTWGMYFSLILVLLIIGFATVIMVPGKIGGAVLTLCLIFCVGSFHKGCVTFYDLYIDRNPNQSQTPRYDPGPAAVHSTPYIVNSYAPPNPTPTLYVPTPPPSPTEEPIVSPPTPSPTLDPWMDCPKDRRFVRGGTGERFCAPPPVTITLPKDMVTRSSDGTLKCGEGYELVDKGDGRGPFCIEKTSVDTSTERRRPRPSPTPIEYK